MLLPAAMPLTMRDMNSENSAGFCAAVGFDELLVELDVVVLDEVVDDGVKLGIDGIPIWPTRPGAAVRNCSMPCCICIIASSACGLDIIFMTSGFCICCNICGIIERICSCICGLLASNGLWFINWNFRKQKIKQ